MDIERLKKLVEENKVALHLTGIHDVSGKCASNACADGGSCNGSNCSGGACLGNSDAA